jgi:outer membrane protein assembly factor BamB
MLSLIPLLFGLAIVSLPMTETQADDWPHFRGANFDDKSTETGLQQQWDSNGPDQVWINKNSGLGYAGFAIVGDQLFTLGLENEEEFGLCLNAETGEELWRKSLGQRFQNKWGDGPRSTPTVDGDHVYFLTAAGSLACLNKSDGSEVWSISMKDFGGKVPVWGYAESPLVDGDNVICTPGGSAGTILAVNKSTGELAWQSEAVPKSVDSSSDPTIAHYSSLLPIEWNEQRQYVQLLERAIVGFSANDGTVLWRVEWPGRVAVIPSPVFEDGNVYVTSGYGIGSKMLKLGESNSVAETWFSKAMQNHHGGVVKVGDFVYGSSAKSFVCQNAADGKPMWSERKIKKGALSYADGRFYHVEEGSGTVKLIEADENKATVQGQFVLSPQTNRRKPDGRIWVHPVVSDGKLYLRDQEIIYCYDIKAQ